MGGYTCGTIPHMQYRSKRGIGERNGEREGEPEPKKETPSVDHRKKEVGCKWRQLDKIKFQWLADLANRSHRPDIPRREAASQIRWNHEF